MLLQEGNNSIQCSGPTTNRKIANTQVVLLSAGCIHKANPKSLEQIARSSIYLNAISNRIAASFPRSRLLGMIVGTAVSKLVDKPDKRMDFCGDMDSDEVRWYISLTNAPLNIGTLADLNLSSAPPAANLPPPAIKKRDDAMQKKPSKPKGVAPSKLIQDVSNAKTDRDNGLVPYQKPDSDPEDEDDDPTLVNRVKLSRPVYVVPIIFRLLARSDRLYEVTSAT